MPRTLGRRDLTPNERQQMICFLKALAHDNGQLKRGAIAKAAGHFICFLKALAHDNGQLKRGAIAKAAGHFTCHRNTVTAVWKERELSGPKPLRKGREPKYDVDELKEKIESVPREQRRTVRLMASALRMPASSLQAYIGTNGPVHSLVVQQPTPKRHRK